MISTCKREVSHGQVFAGSRPLLFSPPHLWLNGEDEGNGVDLFNEDDSNPSYDPCYRYRILDQSWRASNYSTRGVKCDRQVRWQGWYRLYYRGKSIQMPEKCIPANRCGTHAPLWLTRPHPKMSDGIVTRGVCGNWKKNCCAFRSTPIQVKACRGNYYVYRFVRPTACHLAYCAGKIQSGLRPKGRRVTTSKLASGNSESGTVSTFSWDRRRNTIC